MTYPGGGGRGMEEVYDLSLGRGMDFLPEGEMSTSILTRPVILCSGPIADVFYLYKPMLWVVAVPSTVRICISVLCC